MTVKKFKIMYFEPKEGIASVDAWIGKVEMSKTGKTLRYDGREMQSLKGGYKANYFDIETGERFWISGCRKDGNDGLYRTTIHIDEDVREEYWLTIRKLPEQKHKSSFISTGKHKVGRQDLKNKSGNI